MRFCRLICVLFVCAGTATLFFGLAKAQAPGRAAAPAAQRGNAAPAAQAHGNLAQVMRGILFPNSNVIFYTQTKNPADVKPADQPSESTDPLTSTYAGWPAVENSSLALAEAANLLTIPGRKCSNGRAVPVRNADWVKFVQGLRDAGMVAYKAAQSKNKDNMLDAADAVTTACSNCHDVYREKPGGVADRCL